jgi:hypothetical protein
MAVCRPVMAGAPQPGLSRFTKPKEKKKEDEEEEDKEEEEKEEDNDEARRNCIRSVNLSLIGTGHGGGGHQGCLSEAAGPHQHYQRPPHWHCRSQHGKGENNNPDELRDD